MKYLLTIDGSVISDKPMTLDEVINTFGSVKQLEKEGFRLIPVKGNV